jgi:NTP pyrophosphatase (non-canonical NTP hydrolase)
VKDGVLEYVWVERVRQDRVHGVPWERGYSGDRWLRVLVEEVGEVARALEEGDDRALVLELVQVAAVAVAFVEAVEVGGE